MWQVLLQRRSAIWPRCWERFCWLRLTLCWCSSQVWQIWCKYVLPYPITVSRHVKGTLSCRRPSLKLMDAPSRPIYGTRITTKHYSYPAPSITPTTTMWWQDSLHLMIHTDFGCSLRSLRLSFKLYYAGCKEVETFYKAVFHCLMVQYFFL